MKYIVTISTSIEASYEDEAKDLVLEGIEQGDFIAKDFEVQNVSEDES